MNRDSKFKVISIILLVGLILFVSLYLTKSVNCPEIEKKALVDAQIYDWAENLDNSNEMFFTYNLYNYGEVEAKNIVVKCDLWDEKGQTILATVKDNYGNLASLSVGTDSVITKDVANNYDLYIPLCYVSSCDNCDILYKKIPDLITNYEG